MTHAISGKDSTGIDGSNGGINSSAVLSMANWLCRLSGVGYTPGLDMFHGTGNFGTPEGYTCGGAPLEVAKFRQPAAETDEDMNPEDLPGATLVAIARAYLSDGPRT